MGSKGSQLILIIKISQDLILGYFYFEKILVHYRELVYITVFTYIVQNIAVFLTIFLFEYI